MASQFLAVSNKFDIETYKIVGANTLQKISVGYEI